MFAKIILVVAVIAAASANKDVVDPAGGKASRDPIDNTDIYSCAGKNNGNYVHPSDCTRFIMCTEGRAADFPCADCDQNNILECDGEAYLRWNQTINRCEWPRYTPCVTDPQDPATTTTQRTTTTKRPTTTTTTEKDEGTTDAPSQGCNGMVEGASCTKDDCELCGWCVNKTSLYLRCVRTFPSDPKDPITGVIVQESCDGDHWWNPDIRPVNSTVGGACDKWEGLSDEVQQRYKNDPECVPVDPLCEWGQDEADKCTERHWYLDPKKSPERQDLSCSTGLVWDPSTETCRDRANVEGCH